MRKAHAVACCAHRAYLQQVNYRELQNVCPKLRQYSVE